MQATTAPGSSAGQFVDKTDLAPGTKWTATDANAWQAELLHVITEAGLTPSGADLEQVRKAIQALAKLVKVDEATEADHADEATNSTKVNGLNVAVFNIGDWNMDSVSTVYIDISSIFPNNASLQKIRSIDAVIRSDIDYANLYKVWHISAGGYIHGLGEDSGTKAVLMRNSGGTFDQSGFDSTSYNRGWITIFYTD